MSVKVPLVPSSFSRIVKTAKRIGVFGELFLVAILLPLFLLVGFENTETIILLLLTFGGVFAFGLIPGLLYDGICRMEAVFSEDKLCIYDKRGTCRREIAYEQITRVCVQEITGFFYGMNRDEVKHKYICFFLNGEMDIPDVSYARLFRQENFIIVGYQEELYCALKVLPLNQGERS